MVSFAAMRVERRQQEVRTAERRRRIEAAGGSDMPDRGDEFGTRGV